MAGTRKFRRFGGEEVEAEVVGFRATGEHWNQYLLDDGTVFRIKLVLTEISRLEDRYDANGDPVYAASHTQVTAVDVPESLRRPAGGLSELSTKAAESARSFSGRALSDCTNNPKAQRFWSSAS